MKHLIKTINKLDVEIERKNMTIFDFMIIFNNLLQKESTIKNLFMFLIKTGLVKISIIRLLECKSERLQLIKAH